MDYAGFDDLDEAKNWRSQHGGFIALGENGQAIWFNIKFTPTPIMLHPATRVLGNSFKLI